MGSDVIVGKQHGRLAGALEVDGCVMPPLQ